MLCTAVGVGLWLAALNVRIRDVKYVNTFMIQVWMYATPVIYSSTLLPERYRFLLSLNPMTGVVEGFRWALLGTHLNTDISGYSFLVPIVLSVVTLISGLYFFRATEQTFADYI